MLRPMVFLCTKGRWGQSSMFSIARVQCVFHSMAKPETRTPGRSRASCTSGSVGGRRPARCRPRSARPARARGPARRASVVSLASGFHGTSQTWPCRRGASRGRGTRRSRPSPCRARARRRGAGSDRRARRACRGRRGRAPRASPRSLCPTASASRAAPRAPPASTPERILRTSASNRTMPDPAPPLPAAQPTRATITLRYRPSGKAAGTR
jgi:hypothetical protein